MRSELRSCYTALLFADLAFAASHDVEGLLWKACFYKPIEEFRTHVRKAQKVRSRWQLLLFVCMGVGLWGGSGAFTSPLRSLGPMCARHRR